MGLDYFSKGDFQSMRMIMCIGYLLTELEPTIEPRLRKIDGAWRDFKTAKAFVLRVVSDMSACVPEVKRKQVLAEMTHSRMVISTNRPTTGDTGEDFMFFVPERPYNAIMSYLMENECLLCDKDIGAMRRCWLRKAMEATLPWEFPKKRDAACPLQGMQRMDMPEETSKKE